MCPSSPDAPPAPEPLPITPPFVTKGLTGKKQMSPQTAGEEDNPSASNKSRVKLGRGSLKIPLASEGSGLNYPTS